MQDFVATYSRGPMALATLGSALFVLAGCWMVGAFGAAPSIARYSPTMVSLIGWAGVAVFGVFGLMGLSKLFTAGEALRIGPVGVQAAGWSDRPILWSEIRDITEWSHRGQRMIVLHLNDPSLYPAKGLRSLSARANRKLTGGDITLSLTGTDRGFEDAAEAIRRFRPA